MSVGSFINEILDHPGFTVTEVTLVCRLRGHEVHQAISVKEIEHMEEHGFDSMLPTHIARKVAAELDQLHRESRELEHRNLLP